MPSKNSSKTVSSDSLPEGMTRTESLIYGAIKSGKGSLVPYRKICEAVFGNLCGIDDGTIRAHISRMRGKLPEGERIAVKRGRGYRIVETVDAADLYGKIEQAIFDYVYEAFGHAEAEDPSWYTPELARYVAQALADKNYTAKHKIRYDNN